MEVGLENVDNTSDANKSVKYATSAGSANAVGAEHNIYLFGIICLYFTVYGYTVYFAFQCG